MATQAPEEELEYLAKGSYESLFQQQHVLPL